MITRKRYRFRIREFTVPNLDGMRRKVERRFPTRCSAFLIMWVSAIVLLASIGWGQASGMPESNPSAIERKWGVQIVGIRQTAAGHMLDFRYRVVDSKKAAPLFARQTKPYLIDQASGKSLAVPNMAKVGPLRSSNQPREGRTYWMFFGNPGLVKVGNKVTVVIGEFRAENLRVE